MNRRTAVDLARRCLEDPNLQTLGQTQHVNRPMYTCLDRLDRIILVMNRAGGAGQIEDLVDLHIQREAHVVANHLEVRMVQQGNDILARARVEIVDTDDLMALRQQSLAQMASNEAGAPGYKYSFHGSSWVPCASEEST